MSRPIYLLPACFLTAALVSEVNAEVVSTFDSDLDGWTGTEGITWSSTDGNPGGYLRFQDFGPANGGQAFASSAFLGDLSSYIGGTLSLDYRVFQSGPGPFAGFVEITGTAGTAAKSLPFFDAPSDWTGFSVSMSGADWGKDDATWAAILGDVTQIRFSLAVSSGATEITGIDNVRLTPVPEPASMAALGLGALGLLARRRRKSF